MIQSAKPNNQPASHQPVQADPTGITADSAKQSIDAPLLSVRNLKTYFPVRRGLLRRHVGDVRAVDDVSFDITPGRTLGLVGESGCGKSTVGRSILRLIPTTSGSVHFKGRDVFAMDRRELHSLRQQMQIIFQDPVGSLNPRLTVGSIVGEPMLVHGIARGSELDQRVAELLKKVGLEPDHARRYPHEFSGGQRQRIGIARALSLGPEFIVCDEPVSALDVSIQSQILNLLADLRDELGLSYLFIAHNLAVVEHFCDDVAVMYLGRIVELAPRDVLYRNPIHPYTQALLSAAPMPDPTYVGKRIMLMGDVPSPIHMFHDDGRGDPARDELDPADDRLSKIVQLGDKQEQVTAISRADLLHRPPLEPVPCEPGHFVSPSRTSVEDGNSPADLLSAD